jgi:predicted permease
MAAEFRAPLSYADAGLTERVRGNVVSGNFFQVLGLRPAAGRLLTLDDERQPGAHPVAILSNSFWQQRYGGKPDVVGRKVLVNGFPMTIVGVAEPGLTSLEQSYLADVFVPLMMKKQITPTWDGLDSRRVMWLSVFGRLREGVTMAQSERELQALYAPLMAAELEEFPNADQRLRDRWKTKQLHLTPAARGTSEIREAISQPLMVLMGMVAVVLLIACANLANLLIARAAGRRKEIAVRTALGASRWRIVRQLLIDCLVLSLIGGALGLLLSAWTLDALLHYLGAEEPVGQMLVRLDGRAMAFTGLLSVLAALLFGLFPALQASRPDVAPALKEEGASVSAAGGQVQFRRALIVTQVSMSLLLLAVAGLFSRSLFNLRNVDPGFRVDSLIQFGVDAPLNGYSNAATIDFYTRLQATLASASGVTSVTMASEPLLSDSYSQTTIQVPGLDSEGRDMNPLVNIVGPGFFRSMGIPLLSGREFEVRDSSAAPRVAVVNQAFAEAYFPGRDPIGQQFYRGRRSDDQKPFQIVGLVKDSKYGGLREERRKQYFRVHTQVPDLSGMTFYVRASMAPEAVTSLVRQEASRLDQNLPIDEFRTVSSQVDRNIAPQRMASILSAAFGLLATMLAAIGLYGVMSFLVARRTREIGIRIAMGALRGNVIWLVMREVAVLAGAGLLIGLPLAAAAGRAVQSQLFGVNASEWGIYAAAALVTIIVSALAGLVPARRATGIDPIRALRYE